MLGILAGSYCWYADTNICPEYNEDDDLRDNLEDMRPDVAPSLIYLTFDDGPEVQGTRYCT